MCSIAFSVVAIIIEKCIVYTLEKGDDTKRKRLKVTGGGGSQAFHIS